MNKNILSGIAVIGGLSLVAGTYYLVKEPTPSRESSNVIREVGTSVSDYSSGNLSDRDCSDFSTQSEAQRFFLAEGGPRSDPHRLDRDDDGEVCETLP